MVVVAMALVALCVTLPTHVVAAVPELMNYQGRMTDSAGYPILDGTYDVIFSIYDNSAGGTALWAETLSVQPKGGLFNVQLGTVHSVANTLFNDSSLWLGLALSTGAELTPRQRLITVAYAFRAANADSAATAIYADTAFFADTARIADTAFVAETALVVLDSVWSVSGDNVYRLNGNVGIGTMNPTAKLHVTGQSQFDGTVNISTGTGIEMVGESGNALNIGSPTGIALQGTTASADISFLTNNATRMVVNEDGRVGIGTSSPAKELHVVGNVAFDNGGSDVALYGASDNVEHNHYLKLLNATSLANAWGLKAGGVLIADSYAYANPGKNDLIVKGNVGIGTTAPSYTLHVNGSFSAGTVNTGQGNNELYDMDQNVRTTDAPTFATVNTGQGANELFDMDQNVKTTDTPTFNRVYLSDYGYALGGFHVGGTSDPGADNLIVDGALSMGSNINLNDNYLNLGGSGWIKWNYESAETYINAALGEGIVLRFGDANRKLRASHDGTTGRLYSYGSLTLDAQNNTIWAERINPSGTFYLGGSGDRWDIGYFRNVDASGTITAGAVLCGGAKCAIVPTSLGTTKLYAQESPESWFEDFGEGQLEKGRVHIELDPLFLETVTIAEKHSMKVFVTLNDDCNGVYVKRGLTGFDVIEMQNGKSGAQFTYRVVAKRKGFEDKRLEVVENIQASLQ
ncbi:MAG TPA: hypothetical protein VN285_12005 [Candidatus Deferrimicrobium sp.]|nr:hypothetical protein [Candidatus Deferrimicrobium sp.]